MNRALAVTMSTLALTLLGAGSASAALLDLDDPAGDAAARGPDIVHVAVRNLDRSVVVEVRLAEEARGDVIVSIDPRGARGVRMVSEHRPGRSPRNQVVPGAFTDRRAPGPAPDCVGFRVRWNQEKDTVVMRLPARCLQDGTYGAIRASVLTENGGGDSDWAPETRNGDVGSSEWVPRG